MGRAVAGEDAKTNDNDNIDDNGGVSSPSPLPAREWRRGRGREGGPSEEDIEVGRVHVHRVAHQPPQRTLHALLTCYSAYCGVFCFLLC